MKILGICCSPRLHGNTEIMLQTALAKAKELGAEVELITLAGKTISPCDACYFCREAGECRIADDMQDIYPKLLLADGIIFATPVFFWSVTAQAKALIDRTFAFHKIGGLENKAAAVIVTAGRSGSSSAWSVFNSFANGHRMIMLGRAAGFGGREEGVVREDKRGMADAEALGQRMVTFLQSYHI